MKAVIGVGTNVGDRLQNIRDAKKRLGLFPKQKLRRFLFVYETEPWGYDQQDNFLNCVMTVETNLSSRALLGVCLGIEAGIGRVRTIKNGPRVIDLDLLFYENETADTPELMLPHPGVKRKSVCSLSAA